MGMGGGSKPQQTHTVSTEKSDPWGPQQPYLMRGFQEAERLLQRPVASPFMWAPPQADETIMGNQLIMDYLFGSGAMKARDPIYDPAYSGTFNPVMRLYGIRGGQGGGGPAIGPQLQPAQLQPAQLHPMLAQLPPPAPPPPPPAPPPPPPAPPAKTNEDKMNEAYKRRIRRFGGGR